MFVVDFLELLFLLRAVHDEVAAVVAGACGRNAHVHHNAGAAGGNAEGCIFHFRGLFTEDGAKETFFRGQFRFRFRRNFADENVAGLHFRADADDSVMVQVFQGFITGVRDITGDFFRAQLGITGLHFKLGDVDGGEGVFLHGFSEMTIASSKL